MFVWDISPVMLTLGPIQVRYYGLLFAIMLIGGYYLWQWQMLRGGHTQSQAEGFFLWGAMLDISAAAQELWGGVEQRPPTSLYIIRNSQIEAAAEQVERNLIDIATRSMITLLKAVAMGDLIRVWALAQRDDVDFNYVGIPPEHEESTAAIFKPAEMRRLFDLGHSLATGPEPWVMDVPSFIQ